MQTEALTSETHSCYSRNMASLVARQPVLAATVAAIAPPDSVVATMGRDGTPSFRIEDVGDRPQSATRRPRWLGGSSMPGISAHEIFACFVSDGRSVILPGVLTGVEPLVLAEKLPLHAAVFVVEEDPVQLKLALCVRDYADLIAAGRIVFVLGDGQNCVGGLREFFEGHPGYELPMHLLPVPQRTSTQMADLQTGIEAAGRAIVDVHAGVVEKLVAGLRRRSRGVLPGAPRVAVLGVDPMPGSMAQARRIGRALTVLNWTYTTCVPNAPERCHLAGRLAAVEQVGADMILLVNTAVGLSGTELPPDLPVASWHLPGWRHFAPGTPPPDSRQVCFASSLSVYDELVGGGCEPSVIEHCGVAADTIAFRPLKPPTSGGRAHGADIVVIADLPDARLESCNITLDSHVALWQALAEVVLRHVDDDYGGGSEALLVEAQELSHAEVREPEVRNQFVRLIEDRLVPAGRARAAVEALRAAGHSVNVWGGNWPRLEGGADVRRGPIPDETALNQIFNAAGVVVIADPQPWGVQTALDAIAAGAVVVCAGRAERFAKEHPGLTSIQKSLHLYRTRCDLIQHVTSLVEARRGRDENASAATEFIRSEHSVARRLEQIADTLRRRSAPAREG